MKSLLLVVLVLGVAFANAAYAGDTTGCSKYIEVSLDKVTGKRSVVCKDFIKVPSADPVAQTIMVRTATGGVVVSSTLTSEHKQCVDDGAVAYFLFADGTRSNIKSDTEFNCKGNLVLYLGGAFGKQEILDQLITKPLQTMRISTAKSHVDVEFGPTEANEFMMTARCLAQSE